MGAVGIEGSRKALPVYPYKFESFIAELWEQMGWETKITSGSGDQGKDVIATKQDPVKETHCIQAKRTAETNPVCVDDVREYGYLINQDQNCDIAILVTTGRFSRQAGAESNTHNIRLIDGKELTKIVKENDTVGLVNHYALVFS